MAESVLDQFKEVFKENKIDASRKVRIGIIGTGWIADAHMISYLKQEHLLETRGRANTKGKRINGLPTECFCLILPAVELDDEELDELPL